MARLDARVKALGDVKYVADVELPGMLHGACVRSAMPHARIVRIDASAALDYPGVVGVYTAADVCPNLYGCGVLDIPILARGEANYVGERIAAVVATDRRAAEIGASLVVVDYEELPPVTSLDEALRPGGPLVHEEPWLFPRAVVSKDDGPNLQSVIEVGSESEAAAALARAAYVVDESFRTPGVHQGYLETHACVAFLEPSGTYKLWATNKSAYRLRAQLAELFEIDPESIEIQPSFIGGDFGGKGTFGEVPICLELTRLTGRPVKMVLRYSEDLIATNPRHPSRTQIRVGCDNEGHLCGIYVESVFDGGAYAGFKRDAMATVRGMLETPLYRTPGFFTRERVVYTNTVPRGSMRAPGGPQLNFAFESSLDQLADLAGIEPIELRRRNLLVTGDHPSIGHPWVEYRGIETLDAAVAAVRPRSVPDNWLYGKGLAMYGRSTRSMANTSLRLIPRSDGGIRAEIPLSETGAGSHTVMRQLLSNRLRIPLEKIEVTQVSTAALPKDHGASGSRVTASVALIVDLAADAWLKRDGNEPIEVEIELSAGAVEHGSMAVQIAQVAVDPETGQVTVLEILSAIDVAEIVNPMAHQMQIDGGMAMGYGFACLEDLDESEGQIWAANLGEFKIPSARDVPPCRTVLVHGGKGVGATNVKNIGEMTNPITGAAVANAIFNATGCRLRELPLKSERVFDQLAKQTSE